jgi:primosomal protein N' (replication factor Y)
MTHPVAQVVIDIPTRTLEHAFSYLVPAGMAGLEVGCCVLVDFGPRPAVGYVVGFAELGSDADLSSYKFVREVLSTPYFDEVAARCASWIAHEYVAPLSTAVHLFAPPGGSPKVKRDEQGAWKLVHPGVGPVDDRWVRLTEAGRSFVPPKSAVKQRALVAALQEGEMRMAELAVELGPVSAQVKVLEKRGIVSVEHRRRMRGSSGPLPPDTSFERLTPGQAEALDAIRQARASASGQVVVCDGVTGSGKTEVYLRAIREVLDEGGGAIVLVPEIALTPQTVGRFRARFGALVAVLHSRMAAGERFDQWDLVRSGAARVVVGTRSALFAPVRDLTLVVIDEEHETTYKQDSAPRYHARDVAAHMMRERGGTLVLGSATPSIESLARCARGSWRRVQLPERTTGRPLPPVTVVDMAREFGAGHRSMFSRELLQALEDTLEAGHKAVLLLNQRGFASFLLCRECGYVPSCDNCSTSLTYHEHTQRGPRLMCHHCGAIHPVPARCPRCGSPYLRKFGTGTQRVHDELASLLDDEVTIVRMDADTTKGKGAHARLLERFDAAEHAVLLGTQMIAKGLDYPEVTLVGVINADTTLNLPDFRAGERTYQLLEQVSGRAGRGVDSGRVIVQTYWPEHPAIRAAATHDRGRFLSEELPAREELGYPPYTRLANVILWGRDREVVGRGARELGASIGEELRGHADWRMLGPSPCVLSQLRGVWRWHIIVKAPVDADIPSVLARPLKDRPTSDDVSCAVDVDPMFLL